MDSNARLSGMLVDAHWIAAHLDDPTVRLVELDVSGAAYAKGHIPGAVLWNAYTDLRHSDYGLVGKAEFEVLLAKSGITPDMTVVFYGYAPYLGFWLMKANGHDDVRLMDGSRDQWEVAGNAWSTEVPVPEPGSYRVRVREFEAGSSTEAVMGMVGTPGQVILDVRSQAEYDGDRFWPSGAPEKTGRAGHIPGAVHIPIDLMRTEDGRFKRADEIRQLLRNSGVVPELGVVTYCTIGNRASVAWFALKYLLDYPKAQVYYGSWAEWGTRADTPVA
jgi:thiosulfate/3-mercaptopyruvate sulfurtransferase